MTVDRRQLIGALPVALCVLLALALAVTAPSNVQQERQWIETKRADLALIENHRARLQPLEAVEAAYRALPRQPLPDLARLAVAAGIQQAADIQHREKRVVLNAWMYHRREVIWDAVSFEALDRFLYRAESARPPWRLMSIALTAAEDRPGFGRAVCILEGVEPRLE